MANIKGIELSSEIYGLEDETARTEVQTATTQIETVADDVDTLSDKVGNLADLKTTAKTDLVSAVNEVNTKASPSRTIFELGGTADIAEVFSRGSVHTLLLSGLERPVGAYDYEFPNKLPTNLRPFNTIEVLALDSMTHKPCGQIAIYQSGEIFWYSPDDDPLITSVYISASTTWTT